MDSFMENKIQNIIKDIHFLLYAIKSWPEQFFSMDC